jgi:hypothetical protein
MNIVFDGASRIAHLAFQCDVTFNTRAFLLSVYWANKGHHYDTDPKQQFRRSDLGFVSTIHYILKRDSRQLS